LKFNIIGFGPSYSVIPPDKYKHCVVHPGTRLISKPDEAGILFCPLCGTSYLQNDTSTEERITPKHNKQQTRIITPKKSKKYYDKQGNLINDEQLIKDIANGKTVIYYNEVKSGLEKKYTVRN